MKKSIIVALGAGLAVSLSGLSIASTTSNPFQTGAVTTNTHDVGHKSTTTDKSTSSKKMKNGKCGTGKCKGKKCGKCGKCGTGKCKGMK